MSPLKKGRPTPATPEVQNPRPQRPQTFLRRISSGIASVLSMLPLQRGTPQRNSTQRPRTAPNPDRIVVRRTDLDASRLSERQRVLMPRVAIPVLSDPEDPCPYDPNRYHSFPSIERQRCDFCGLRPPGPSSIPCNDCRSRSPLTHIGVRRHISGLEIRRILSIRSPRTGPQHSPESSDEGPRIVPPEIAARRIGNPPRRASLPVPRLSASNVPNIPPNSQVPLPPSEDPATIGTRDVRPRTSGAESNDVRPTSPKLHHLHGLPNTKTYPYVHKREVNRHLAAIQAGTPSTLTQAFGSINLTTSTLFTDYSETVCYDRSLSPNAATRSSHHHSLAHSRRNMVVYRTEGNGDVLVNRSRRERCSRFSEELGVSDIDRRRSPEQHPRPPNPVSQTLENESADEDIPPRVGGRILEIRGGGAQNETPGLRGGGGGGGGREQRRGDDHGCVFMLKQLLLTCHRSHRGHDDSEDDDNDDGLPPARSPSAVQVARAIRRAHGIARLPANISRGKYGTPLRTGNVSPNNNNTKAARSRKMLPLRTGRSIARNRANVHCLSSHLPSRALPSFLHHQRADSPINLPNPPTTDTQLPVKPSFPSLRGGTGSPSGLRDTERLPPTLFWLAGGRGKQSVTAGSWKSRRPKKRTGGLLGLAMYGMNSGTEYGSVTNMKAIAPVVSSAPAAEEGGGVGSGGSVKSSKSSAKSHKSHSPKSSSSSSSRSSSRSRAGSRPGEPIGPAAHEGEAHRDNPLEPIPEDAPPAGGRVAAEDVLAAGDAAPPAEEAAANEALAEEHVEGAAPAQEGHAENAVPQGEQAV
ncbi:hypothetical protein EJ02DRAFT_467639 [Clathrospora elynae]|uniref:Uncharacterized protein n=1 Tax=Clathrospora elynae TaxID=706981 RepID=A0A6A5SK77_9PLEO|nr:hypothetical protein EJ02DRAFT_467639 [Clathrospora elynae]